MESPTRNLTKGLVASTLALTLTLFSLNLAVEAAPGDDCAFNCTNGSDPWTELGSSDEGLWVIVTAKPVSNSLGYPDLVWRQSTQTPLYWPPMSIVVTWTGAGGRVHVEQKLVRNDGTCNDGNSSTTGLGPGDGAPSIRCHEGVDSDSNYLCDSFAGVWERITDGTVSNCVIEAHYGIDMRRRLTIGGNQYTWAEFTVAPVNPVSAGVGLHAYDDCTDNQVWSYQHHEGVTHDCDDVVDLYRNGSASGIDVTLNYTYNMPE